MNIARTPFAAVILLTAAVPTVASAQGISAGSSCMGGDFHYLRFQATYGELGQVRQLDLDLEADKRSSYKLGQKVTFYLDGKKLGAATFKKDRNGDLDADFKLRSTSGKGFPTMKSGAKVSAEIRDVTVSDCKLR